MILNKEVIESMVMANEPIFIQGIGEIFTFTLKDIVKFNYEDYFKILYILTSDKEDLDNYNLSDDFIYFDYIISICYTQEKIKNQILEFLKIVFKKDVHFLPSDMCFIIGDYIDVPANEINTLDKDNFEDFVNVLRIQNQIEDKDKKPSKKQGKQNPKVEELKKKAQAGRALIAKARGEQFSLQNLISTLTIFLLDIEKVLNLNIYQSNILYRQFLKKERFEMDYKAYLVGADIKHLSINKHWSANSKYSK